MKRVLFILALFLVSLSIQAQKINVKKDKLLFDKVPVAGVSGDCGLFNGIDLTYKSLDGKPLLRIKMSNTHHFITAINDTYWYNIDFFESGKNVKIYIKAGATYSDTKLSQMIFGATPPVKLVNNQLDTASITSFKAAFDESKKIVSDTLAYVDYEAFTTKCLVENGIPERDLSKPVICKKTDENSLGTKVTTFYNIIQDNVVVGQLEKVDTPAPFATTEYKFFVTYKKPFVLGDKTFKEGLAAFLTAGTFSEICTIKDKKKFRLPKATGAGSQDVIAKYLVSNHYL